MKQALRNSYRRLRLRGRWHATMANLRAQVAIGRKVNLAGVPPVAVILQSFSRPMNMSLIARTALCCSFVDRVVLTNNNPEVDIRRWVKIRDPRFHMVTQERKKGCGMRFEIAAGLPNDYFISIDDDLFLNPEQIASLYLALLEEPSVPHGLVGQQRRFETGNGDSSWELKGSPAGYTGPVDVINCVMAFSREHVKKYHELLGLIGMSGVDDIGSADDIVISASGSGRALCHHFGPTLSCPTTADPDIAMFQQHGFRERRKRIYAQVHAAR